MDGKSPRNVFSSDIRPIAVAMLYTLLTIDTKLPIIVMEDYHGPPCSTCCYGYSCHGNLAIYTFWGGTITFLRSKSGLFTSPISMETGQLQLLGDDEYITI